MPKGCEFCPSLRHPDRAPYVRLAGRGRAVSHPPSRGPLGCLRRPSLPASGVHDPRVSDWPPLPRGRPSVFCGSRPGCGETAGTKGVGLQVLGAPAGGPAPDLRKSPAQGPRDRAHGPPHVAGVAERPLDQARLLLVGGPSEERLRPQGRQEGRLSPVTSGDP